MAFERIDIFDKICMPAHVLWCPLKVALWAGGACGGLAFLLRDQLDGFGSWVAIALYVVIHLYVARRFREDWHIVTVWKQNVVPPDFAKPGARRLLRLRTVNLLPGRGRKYTI